MRKLCLLLLLYLTANPLYAQPDTLLANQLLDDAKLLFQQTKYKDAIAKSLEATEIYEVVFGNPSLQVAKAKKSVAIAYGVLQQFSAAKPYFEEVLKIHQELLGENSLEAGKGYNNMGVVYRRIGELQKAKEYFERTLVIYKAELGENNEKLVGVYSNLANVYKKEFNFHQALLLRKAALRIIETKFGNQSLRFFNTQRDIAGDYFMQEEFTQALQWYKKNLLVYKKLLPPSHPDFIDLRSDIGFCQCELNNMAEAEKWFAENEKIIIEHYGKKDIRMARNQKAAGTCYLKKGQLRRATEKLKNAVQILERAYAEQTLEVVDAYMLLGIAQKNAQQYEAAMFSLQKALGYTRYEPSSKGSAADYMPCKLLLKMSKTYQEKYTHTKNLADLKAAKQYIENAVTLARQIRKSYSGESAKAFMAEHLFYLFDQAVEINRALYAHTQEKPFAEAVYTLIEETNSIMLYEMLNEGERLTALGLSEEVILQKKTLEDSLTWLSLEKHKGMDRGEVATTDSLEALIFQYNRKYTAFLQALPDQFTEQQSHLLPLPKLQAQLGADESLVQYFDGDTILLALVINKNDFHLQVLEKDSLEELTADFITAISRYDPFKAAQSGLLEAYTRSAVLLYQKLMAPLKDKLRQKLVIIPSGQLNFIPFSALLETMPSKLPKIKDWPFLLHRYEIQYAFSAKQYTQPAQNSGTPRPEETLLAYAPTFGEARQVALFQQRSPSFSPLAHNRAEAEDIARITNGKTLSGEMATKASFVQYAPGARIVHLATHAQANENELGFSGVAFGDTEAEQLYAKEIYGLEIPAELLVLSACQTALGTSVKGEGVFSLGRAFSIAGVKSIVSSLWKIDDRQTAKLMTAFYQQLTDGKEKATALRQAQLKYISSSSNALAHPAYWAAFVLHGDNDPIDFGHRNWIWWILGLGLLSVIGGFVFLWKR